MLNLNEASNATFSSKMYQDVSTHNYNGIPISFEKGKDVMVNLTQMAQAFPNKNLSKILNSKEMTEYLHSLSRITNVILADLVQVRNGGINPGTWGNSKVALRVAQKLSPDCAVWTDIKIEELLTTGSVALKPRTHREILLSELALLEENEKLNNDLVISNTIIEKNKPKVLFADAVNSSKDSISIRDLAVILKQNGIDIGQNRLFILLREKHFLISRSGTDYNMPTQKAMDLGLFTIKESSRIHSDGYVSIDKTTKVTGKGQQYFINKFLNKKSDDNKLIKKND